ncbi:hypothetical protein N9545_00180 [Salibacteraceae bacterium]|nr:hypothetical protein [Salibacteraceae bacterium]MDB9709680.1 hypothetical protein [Salibacteraceae bacterium]
MRFLSFLILLSIVVASCGNPEAEKAAQKAASDSLLQVQQDSLLDVFRGELQDISQRISQVSVRNGLLAIDSNEGDVLSKDMILKRVESLDGLLSNNKSELNQLYERMRKSNVKNKQMEDMLQGMQARIAEREEQIDKLMSMINDKDVVIGEIKASLDSMRRDNINLTEDVIHMDEEMHTVHYIIGEQKELKEKGVITKEGGILGIGASKKLDVSKLDPALFTDGDDRELLSIPLYSKKAKLITNHPETSYEFIMDSDGNVESLKVNDRKAFWSVTNYLVVEVDN